MKRIFLFLSVLFCTIGVFAQQRSEQEAIQIAQQFFAKETKYKAPQLSVVPQQKVSQSIQRRVHAAKSASTTSSCCYIINDEANNKFVIVSADERVGNVLGYSDEGTFDENVAPNAIIDIIADYNRQYDFLMTNANKIKATSHRKKERVSIPPLLPTMWNGSRAPYKAMCPKVTTETQNDTCVAGVGAVAMAQIMNFHKYPKEGNGSITYTTKTSGINISHDFTKDLFDWDNMLDDYYGIEATQNEQDAVARLMYSCGVSIGTNYTTSGATSEFYDVPYALINIYKYNPNLVAYSRNYFSDEEWYDIIDEELTQKRPIFYSGWKANNTTYLRFIVDGRDEEGLYHINWGEIHGKRTFNGYYSLDILRQIIWEDGTVYKEYSEEDAYNHNQAMICRITPSLIGTHEDVFYAQAFTLKETNTSLNESIEYTLSGPIGCCSTRSAKTTFTNSFLTEIGIGIFDTDFKFIKNISDVVFANNYTTGKSLNISHSSNIKIYTPTLEEGKQYYIAPYAIVDGEKEPTRIRTLHGDNDFYLATVKDGKVEFILKGKADKDPHALIITNNFAGELANRISDVDRKTIESLKISGNLNGTDIKLIREMLQDEGGQLTRLDIKEANIVSGGETYDGIYSTENNVIGQNMFNYCDRLRFILLPSNITKIESSVFTFCDGLQGIEIPALCESVSEYAFTNCPNLSQIEVVEENPWMKSVDGILFSKDGSVLLRSPEGKSLSVYTIPNGVNEIGGGAFYNSSIKAIQIPNSVTKIGSSAFYSCENLSHVTIPNSITELGFECFAGCINLESVEMSSNITTIEASTFSVCVKLKEFHIGPNVKDINSFAFYNCMSLQKFIIDDDNETYCSVDGVIYTKDMKTLVMYPRGLSAEVFDIPIGIEKISDNAFDACKNIVKINLPKTITSIGEYAFQNCDITEIRIPANVTSIGYNAFLSCGSLAEISCEINDTNIKMVEFGDGAFFGIPDDCIWFIAKEWEDAYKDRPWWVSTWQIMPDAINAPQTGTANFEIYNGNLYVKPEKGGMIRVYSVDGTLVKSIRSNGNEACPVDLPRGMYIINNKKLLIE